MANLDFKNIIYQKDGPVAVLRINREPQLNAVDAQTSSEMFRAWEDFRDDSALRVCILTGTGAKSFSTGMDLVATARGENQFEGGRRCRSAAHQASPSTSRYRRHKRHCSPAAWNSRSPANPHLHPEARFGLPEVRWASSGAGGTQRLPRAIPHELANYMILTATRSTPRPHSEPASSPTSSPRKS